MFSVYAENARSSVSCRGCGGKLFHTRGSAALKLRSPKLLCVRGTKHVLNIAIRYRTTESDAQGAPTPTLPYTLALFFARYCSLATDIYCLSVNLLRHNVTVSVRCSRHQCVAFARHQNATKIKDSGPASQLGLVYANDGRSA